MCTKNTSLQQEYSKIKFLLHKLCVFYSYGISVGLGHITAFLPYISDTGVLAPERSVFSQLINIAAFLHMTTVYIRFRHVNLEIKTRWNETGFCGRCVYHRGSSKNHVVKFLTPSHFFTLRHMYLIKWSFG